MALTHKMLGQLRPSTTSATSIYSPAASTQAIIRQIFIINNDASARIVTLYLDDDGSTYDDTTIFWTDLALAADAVTKLDVFITMDDTNGNLAVKASIADQVNFTVWGVEIT